MEKTVRKMKEQVQPYLEYGVVTEEGKKPVVETGSGPCRAVMAASCLVKPGIGDRVLVSIDGDGLSYILAVLVRSTPEADQTLYFEGNVNLHAEGGALSLTSSESVSLASERMSLAAKTGEAVFDDLSLTGNSFTAHLGSIRTIAGTVEHLFHRLTERLVDAFRFVKGHEEVQTGSTRYLVEENLTMHSKNAMHVAEEIVSINAEQINLC